MCGKFSWIHPTENLEFKVLEFKMLGLYSEGNKEPSGGEGRGGEGYHPMLNFKN
jgi:hypothetical protein